jgi:hypothetical protein
VKGYIVKLFDLVVGKTAAGAVKRVCEIIDDTKLMTRVVFWNDAAVNFKASKYDLICIKLGKIGSYQGKQISINEGTLCLINPDEFVIEKKAAIKHWKKAAKGRFVN